MLTFLLQLQTNEIRLRFLIKKINTIIPLDAEPSDTIENVKTKNNK